MEALQIKDIDTMIKGLEQELKGVEVSEIVVTTPAPDLSSPKEVITITEDEIVATIPDMAKKESAQETQSAKSAEKEIEHRKQGAKSEQGSACNETVLQTHAANPVPHKAITSETVVKPDPLQTEPGIGREAVHSHKEEETAEETVSPTQESVYEKRFKTLLSKIYDRDYDLGSCFERNITFVNFSDNLLTWESTAEDADKQMLITHWGIINMFVKELFGFETKIKNIAKKKVKIESRKQAASSNGQGADHDASLNAQHSTLNAHEPPIHNDADSGSMIEEIEMKSSCIAPDAGDTEAAKEKDPSTLLEEPMVKTALELLNPKKVRIKRNV